MDRAPIQQDRYVLRGCDFSAARFRSSVTFPPTRFIGKSTFVGTSFDDVDFTDAKFDGPTTFMNATFNAATFTSADFQVEALFHSVRWEGPVWFAAARFDEARFVDVVFNDRANFSSSRFEDAHFIRAVFEKEAFFDGASFEEADFSASNFRSVASFDDAEFRGKAKLSDTSFGRSLECYRTRFEDGIDFRGCLLPVRAQFVQAEITGSSIDFAGAACPGFVELACSVSSVGCRGTRFLGGGHLRVRGARINLTGAEFPAPFIISSAKGPLPRITSLSEANLTGLMLVGVDLSACTFAYAHDLDGLRLGPRTHFARLKARKGGHSRRVLLDEVLWRMSVEIKRSHRGLWARQGASRVAWESLWNTLCARRGDLQHRPGNWEQTLLDPGALAELYRSLRKGREDSKDEPGAADFYYSEMEMRRLSEDAPISERFLLWCYKGLSGYGLRASRALLAFAALLVLYTALFSVWPLFLCGVGECTKPASAALIHTLTAALGILRFGDDELTLAGQALQIPLRIFGPVLLGLAAFAVRGRVKR